MKPGIKRIIRVLYRNSSLLRRWWFYFRFVINNKYIPNFKNPKTYNEKVNYRKNNAENELFPICADKVEAKKWVSERIGEKFIIPNYFVGDYITTNKIIEIIDEMGDCLLKANHNSGPVYLLTKASKHSDVEQACKDVNRQLEIDYGALSNEPWYSKIKPKVLVEKRLISDDGNDDIRDYKFHVFKQESGDFEVIVEVHFNQSVNHTISYFDENLNWLPITVGRPNIVTKVEKPSNYELMLEKAKILAREFTHVRVDFFNVDGNIYFGELTFAKSGGGAIFMHKMYDLWMGSLWQGDPAN